VIAAKEKGKKIEVKRAATPRATGDVMEALRQSLRVIEGGLGKKERSSQRAEGRKTSRERATRAHGGRRKAARR
jgi:hypothetical protein